MAYSEKNFAWWINTFNTFHELNNINTFHELNNTFHELNTPLAMVCVRNLFTLDVQYKPIFKHKLKTYQIWPNVLAFL